MRTDRCFWVVLSVILSSADSYVQVRALARNPDAVSLPPQVDVVRGDLTLPETLDRCLDGIDAVFLVWCAPRATVAPCLERIAKHARRIVFLSAPLKTAHPPTAPIHERDIAAVAVRAFCEVGHAGAEYVLTGPQSLSQSEQVSTIGRVIGRSLRIEEISPDEARRELLTIMPGPVVNMLLDAWAAAIGQPAFVTSTVADITGAPARTFLYWAIDHAAEFRRHQMLVKS